MSETSEITTPLIKALLAAGLYAVRVQSGKARVRGGFMQFAPKGTPDVFGFLDDGRGFVVETKRSHKDTCNCPSCTAQRLVRCALERRNVKYVFARSVAQALDALGLTSGSRAPCAEDVDTLLEKQALLRAGGE